MNKVTAKSQNGNTHVVIVIVVILIILSALGYLYWKNFLTAKPINSQASSKVVTISKTKEPASKIVAVAGSDMNKYINYANNFEFLIPQQVYSTASCASSNTYQDSSGTTINSQTHYTPAEGVIGTTVIATGETYTVVPKDLVELSDITKTPTGGNLYLACNVIPATSTLLSQELSPSNGSSTLVIGEYLNIHVSSVASEAAALALARNDFQDPTGTLQLTNDTANNREVGDFIFSSEFDGEPAGGPHDLWYYPTQKKFVYIELPQDGLFEYPDQSNNSYLDRIVDSFKLSTE